VRPLSPNLFHYVLPVLAKIIRQRPQERLAKLVARASRVVRTLDNASLLGHFMSRSRKRDVLEKRVQRGAQVLQVRFADEERRVYDYVTQLVREQAQGVSGVRFFALIARQTQLSSCMVAAIKAWSSNGPLQEVMDEAYGLGPWSVDGSDDQQIDEDGDDWSLPPEIANTAILERVDSKYAAFVGFLKRQLLEDPKQKFVVFAFFRGTLAYLERRLTEDGIKACRLVGGMGRQKWAVLDSFKQIDGPNVLLSSEVGSEGIDL
jgi:hypothetical protein